MPSWTRSEIDELVRYARQTLDRLLVPYATGTAMVPGMGALNVLPGERFSLCITSVAFRFISDSTVSESEALLLHALRKAFTTSYSAAEDNLAPAFLRAHYQKVAGSRSPGDSASGMVEHIPTVLAPLEA